MALLAAALVPFGTAGAPARLRPHHWWHPGVVRSWAYVIGENYPLTIPPLVAGKKTPVQVVDSDLGDESGLDPRGAPLPSRKIEASVRAIHAMSARAICYVDAGTTESWRSDSREFAPSEIGRALPGWPGERFIDVSDWSKRVRRPYETLEKLMTNRIALCEKEGFDGIEADNINAYTYGNLGGFRISMRQEETFIKRLVTVAHAHGLAFFLKNEINGDRLLRDLAPRVDGEIDEQCWQYHECGALRIFVRRHKPVLNVEYQHVSAARLCPAARAFPMATIRAGLELRGQISFGCWEKARRANARRPG